MCVEETIYLVTITIILTHGHLSKLANTKNLDSFSQFSSRNFILSGYDILSTVHSPHLPGPAGSTVAIAATHVIYAGDACIHSSASPWLGLAAGHAGSLGGAAKELHGVPEVLGEVET